MLKNTLNNLMLENARKNPLYKAVITDLALCGAIDVTMAERVLGYEIPDYLRPPRHLQVGAKPSGTRPIQGVSVQSEQVAQSEQPMSTEESSEFMQNVLGINEG